MQSKACPASENIFQCAVLKSFIFLEALTESGLMSESHYI